MKTNESVRNRDQILFAAKRELAEKGFDGSRMSSIAKFAKVPKSLIYYYFENKEQLHNEILIEIYGINSEDSLDNFDEFFLSNIVSPQERLYRAIYFLAKIYFTSLDSDYQKIMMHLILEKKDLRDSVIYESQISRFSKLEQIIIDGIELGVFETDFPFLVVINMVSFMMMFESTKHLFVDSPWGDIFSQDKYDSIEKYIIESTFKVLKPKAQELEIPQMTEETKQLIDMLIKQINKNQKWTKEDERDEEN